MFSELSFKIANFPPYILNYQYFFFKKINVLANRPIQLRIGYSTLKNVTVICVALY